MAEQAGSAYIPIRPDARGFHTAIRAELQRLAGPLAGDGEQLARRFGEGFRRGLGRQDPFEPFEDEQDRQQRRQRDRGNEQAGAFAQSFSRTLARAAQQLPRIEVDADSSQAQLALAELQQRMDALSRQTVGVDVSAEDALAELAQIREALAAAGEGADVAVRADLAAALAQLERFSDQVDRLDGDQVDIDVDVDAEEARGSLFGLASAGQLAQKGMSALGSAAGLIRLAPLAAGAGLAAAGLVQMVSALGPLVGLAAALPALLAAKTAALLTLRLALYGVSDAFSAAMTGSAEEFTASLEKLSPAARAVAVELRGLRPQLLGIQQAAQQALFAPLQGQLTKIAATLAGPVRSGVKAVAGEFGLAAQDVAHFAASGQAVDTVRALFSGLTDAVARLRPAITPVISGMAAFVAAGAGQLGPLADSVARLATTFGDWLTRMAGAGKVGEWIGGALAVAQQLGAVLADVGGIISSIFSAMSAAGGGSLGPLSILLNQLNAFLKSAEGSAALGALFTGITQLGSALAPLIPLAGHLVASLVQALLPGVRALTPVISLLVGALSGVLRSVTPILAPLGQLIAGLITGLAPILTPIVTLLTQVAVQLGGALVAALTASLPSIQQLVISIASLLPALLPLVPLFPQFLLAVLPLLPAITQLAALLVGYLVPPLRLAIGFFVSFYTTVFSLVMPVLRLLVGVLTWVAGVIAPILSAIGAGLRVLGDAATWLWQNAFAPALRGIATLAGWLYSAIAVVLITPLLLAFKLVQAAVTFLWRNVFQPVFTAIGQKVAQVWGSTIKPALEALKNFLVNTVGGAVKRFYDSYVKPVFDQVGSKISTVWNNTVRPVFDAIKSAVGKLGGAFSLGVDAISKAWDGLRNAAKKPVNFVIGTIFNKGIVGLWNTVAGLIPGVKKMNPLPTFATGGIYPGYTPGRDIGLVGVSGGEAIMRPEWTRAVGPGFVHAANAAARSGGVGGVRDFMSSIGFGGNFFLGGVVGKFKNAAKGLFLKGLKNAASAAFRPLLALSDRTLGPMGGFGQLLAGVPHAIAAKVMGWFADNEHKIGGDGRKVVSVAEKYVGLSGNPNKFTRRMGMDGYPWCGMFVDGVFDEAGAKAALKGVSWPPLVSTYTSLPKVPLGSAKPGDLALYRGDSGHINIFTGKGLVTIGGNESNAVRRQSGYISSASSIRRPAFASGGIVDVAALLGQDRADNGRRHTHPLTAALRAAAGIPVYDDGGWLPPGLSVVANWTRRPEAVMTDGQLHALTSAAQTGTAAGNTYNVYPRELAMTVGDLERLQRRQDALARVGRPG